MGRAIVGALSFAGHPTTVWNRTPGKAAGLRDGGVSVASTVVEAVSASPVTIVSVLNYDVADELLRAAEHALPGVTIVNLTSDTPTRSRQTAALAAASGARYLDGAIMTPADTIGTPAASVLISGPEAVFEDHRSTLAGLGSAATYLGDDPGRAAAFDVALLDLFWTTITGAAHAVALARAEGIDPRELLALALPIVDIVPPILTDITERVVDNRHTDGTSSVRSAHAAMTHIAAASRDRASTTAYCERRRRSPSARSTVGTATTRSLGWSRSWPGRTARCVIAAHLDAPFKKIAASISHFGSLGR
jgi:3-hydroxyisobutyrate dehydrogenase-like beta-hydroxyacid dehydrogenase